MIDVVKNDDGAIGQFYTPGVKIAVKPVATILPIEMKKVDGAVGKPAPARLYGPPKNFREWGISSVVKFPELNVDVISGAPLLAISGRSAECEALRGQLQTGDRLAKRRVGHAIMGSELYEKLRSALGDKPEGKRDMAPPRAWPAQSFRSSRTAARNPATITNQLPDPARMSSALGDGIWLVSNIFRQNFRALVGCIWLPFMVRACRAAVRD